MSISQIRFIEKYLGFKQLSLIYYVLNVWPQAFDFPLLLYK